MDAEALKNSTETEVDLGLIYSAITNVEKAKSSRQLIEILKTGYGLNPDEAKKVLSDRVEHFKRVIFEQFDMTEEHYDKMIVKAIRAME
jgi:uncharacterized protein YfbU (UPF0304 family)